MEATGAKPGDYTLQLVRLRESRPAGAARLGIGKRVDSSTRTMELRLGR